MNKNSILISFTLIVFTTLAMLMGCAGGENVPNTGNTNTASGANPSGAAPPGVPLASGLAEAEFQNLDGSSFTISQRKGKVLLLNIWGIWCGPCRAEMPHLIEMQEKHGPQGFDVIGFNIGNQNLEPESVDNVKNFAENFKPKPLNYPLALSGKKSTAEFYKISGQSAVPQSFVIDREGRLRGVFVGGGARVVGQMKDLVAKTMAE